MALPWLKLFKQIVHNVLYFSEPFDRTHAWIDLLLLAKDEDQDIMIGLKKVSVPRGDVTESYEELATRWKWSKTKVARFIDFLEEEGMIEKKRNGREGSLTVVKYEFFQGKVIKSGTIKEQSRNNDGTIAEQSFKNISNNINNIYKRDIREEENITPNTLTSITPTGGDTHTDYESEFEEVWKLYPKKQGKGNALRDYIKARKSGVSRETIEDGITAYSDYCRRNDRFFKDGSTWFHQKCWEEDYSEDEPFKKATGCDDLGYSVSEYAEQMKREGLL